LKEEEGHGAATNCPSSKLPKEEEPSGVRTSSSKNRFHKRIL
jgi:hypothetical protein